MKARGSCQDRATLCPPPGEDLDHLPPAGPAADEDLASLARVLGHPARVKIVRLLARRTSCLCGEIVDELPLAQSTVSQHLKRLKDARLVRGIVDGPRVCYCLEPGTLQRFKRLVDDL